MTSREQRLEAALRVVQEWAQNIANDERVCGWVHQADYGLYCFLADCPVDFDAALAEPIAHRDHPLRHFDRTCPACIAESEQEQKDG